LSDNSEQHGLEYPEFDEVRNQAMAFERMLDMSANHESYVDHCRTFPDRVKEYAAGVGLRRALMNGSMSLRPITLKDLDVQQC